MHENHALRLYKSSLKWPLGRRFFSWYAARMAPYFKTVHPLVTELDNSHCEILIRKRKIVQNHIGTVHVIAIANGLEMAMGFLAEAAIPPHLRWIPKSMTLNYVAKAGSDIRCTASLAPEAWAAGNLPIKVTARDTEGTIVVEGVITLWITEKPPKKAA